MLFRQSLMTPIGVLRLEATESGLSAIRFPSRAAKPMKTSETTPVLDLALALSLTSSLVLRRDWGSE